MHRNSNGEKLNHFQVAIIGAGPIGIELAVCLKQAGLSYVQFDANQIGHTLTWWPRNTYFFSTTERLAIAGVPIQDNNQNRITGETYLAYLRMVVELFDLQINAYEKVTAVEKRAGLYEIETEKAGEKRRYSAEKIVLAIGDMHWANQIDIPGENLPHVSHYFNDPHDYFRQRVLIVGGKNSAAESALRCWRAGAQVTLSYRRPQVDQKRVKHWLLPDLEAQIEAGVITFLPSTTPIEITPKEVLLKPTDQMGRPIMDAPTIRHATDFVLLTTGFRGDQHLLRSLGVRLEGENQIPNFDPETMETNVEGLYLAGTVAAGVQQRYRLFIENCHDHAGKITQALTGKWPDSLGTVASRTYDLAFEKFEAN